MKLAAQLCLVMVLIVSRQAYAQTYVGLSANVGNKLTFSPDSEGLRRPVSISGSVLINVNKSLKRGWALQYGGGIGVLGFIIKTVAIDTIAPDAGITRFYEYSHFYVNAKGLIGKEIVIGKKLLLIGAGGGATCYLNLPSFYSFGLGVVDENQTVWEVFEAQLQTPLNRVVPFATIDLQLRLNSLIVLALGYSHHFKPVFSGSYEFYQTENPSAGSMTLYQRELTLKCLVNISKKHRS
jgi:hypothetical protein